MTIWECVRLCICVYMCMYVCVCVCIKDKVRKALMIVDNIKVSEAIWRINKGNRGVLRVEGSGRGKKIDDEFRFIVK